MAELRDHHPYSMNCMQQDVEKCSRQIGSELSLMSPLGNSDAIQYFISD